MWPTDRIFPNCSERAKAEAISAEIRGQCTTSEIPAATNASAPISSADAVASRIGRSGTVSCSAVAKSSAEIGRREMADDQRVKAFWYRSACCQRIARAAEPDRLIAERRKHFLIGKEPLVVDHQHRLAAPR